MDVLSRRFISHLDIFNQLYTKFSQNGADFTEIDPVFLFGLPEMIIVRGKRGCEAKDCTKKTA